MASALSNWPAFISARACFSPAAGGVAAGVAAGAAAGAAGCASAPQAGPTAARPSARPAASASVRRSRRAVAARRAEARDRCSGPWLGRVFGGQKKRVANAATLFRKSEPTGQVLIEGNRTCRTCPNYLMRAPKPPATEPLLKVALNSPTTELGVGKLSGSVVVVHRHDRQAPRSHGRWR